MKSSKAGNMNLKHYFDLSRFWLLLKLELFRSLKEIGMTFVITFGVLFFVGLLFTLIIEKDITVYEHTDGYGFSLIVGGFVLSSLAFRDLGNTLRRYRYLMLPVSALEKFLCMWLLTSVGWIVLFSITFTLYTWVVNPVGQLLFSHVTFRPFELFGEASLDIVKSYFVLQGIFLVGASHFRGYAFPKTLFVLVLLGLVCGGSGYLFLKDVFLSDHECTGKDCELLKRMGIHPVWLIIKWLFWWVLAPWCWVTAYLGLKEQEA